MAWGVELPRRGFSAVSDGGSCRGGESKLGTWDVPGQGPDGSLPVPEDLCPHGGTLWDELAGGRIVNKLAQAFKCSLFYLACFVLLLGSKNPQKCPFAQLASGAPEGPSPADSSFGHVRCPLWPRRVALKSLVWRLVYTRARQPPAREEMSHSTSRCIKKINK